MKVNVKVVNVWQDRDDPDAPWVVSLDKRDGRGDTVVTRTLSVLPSRMGALRVARRVALAHGLPLVTEPEF